MAASGNLFTRILISAEDRASKVFGAVLNKWTLLATALGTAIGAKGLSDAVSKAADFEAALDLIQSKTEASAEEMARFEAAALKAGSETKYTATEAAEALAILGAAGLNATDSIATLPSVLAMAAAEGIGLEQAAGLVTDSVTIMGLSFQESARAADVMTKAGLLTSVSATQIGESLKYAGAEAKNAGLSIEETAAVIDVLAKNGLRGEQAGTALRNILAQLGDPAGSARKELAALWITTGDLRTVIDGVKAAGPQAGAAIRAFGVESGPALQALIAGGSTAINDYTAQLNQAGGAAQTAASVMSDNLTGAFAGLGSAWDTLSIALTKPLLEPIKNAVVELTEKFRAAASDGSLTAFSTALVSGFENAVKAVKQFVGEFDFKTAGVKLSAFVTEAQGLFGNLADGVSVAANTFKAVWNGVYQAVALVGTGIGTVFSKLLEGAAWVASGMETIGLATEGTADKIRVHAGAMNAAAEAMKQESIRAYNDMKEAGGKAADAVGRIATRTAEVGKAAVEAARIAVPATEQHTKALTDAERQLAELIEKEEADAKAKADNARATEQAEAAKQAAFQDTLDDLQILSAEYEDLLAQGDLGGAAGILGQMKAIQQSMKGTADSAEQMSKEVADAFQSLGVTSQAELDQLAENARKNFETIRTAGTSAPEDVEAAFIAYAEKAIAANNGVADSALRAAAAQRGLAVETGAAGDKIVSSSEAAAVASAEAVRSAEAEKQAIKEANERRAEAEAAIREQAEAQEEANATTERGGGLAAWMAKLLRAEVDSLKQYSEAAYEAVDGIMYSLDLWQNKITKVNKLDVSALVNVGEFAEAENQIAKLGAEAAEAMKKANDIIRETMTTDDFFNMDPFYQGIAALEEFKSRVISAKAAMMEMELNSQKLGAAISDLSDDYSRGDLSLTEYIAKLERLNAQFYNVTDEGAEALKDAITAAKQEMSDFAESAQDGLRDLQAEWADLNGQQIDAMMLEQQMERIAVEMELADAKKRGNTEEIRALEAQLALLDQIHEKQLANLAEEEAEQAIKDAEDAAREAERWANLTDEERQHETAINSLEDALADAILAKNAALKQSILDQIAAENARHDAVMANLDEEDKAKNKPPTVTTATDAGGTTGGAKPPATETTGPVAAVRTVNVNIAAPSGATGTVRVLEGDEDILTRILQTLETGRTVAQR